MVEVDGEGAYTVEQETHRGEFRVEAMVWSRGPYHGKGMTEVTNEHLNEMELTYKKMNK